MVGFLLPWRWMEVSAFCLSFQSVPLYDQWWASTSLCTDKHTQPWGLSVHQLLVFSVFYLTKGCLCMRHRVCVSVSYCIRQTQAVLITLMHNEKPLRTVTTNLSFLSRIYISNTDFLNLLAVNSSLKHSKQQNQCLCFTKY